jgi:hypothetical protein
LKSFVSALLEIGEHEAVKIINRKM